jgi:hypothetical protein
MSEPATRSAGLVPADLAVLASLPDDALIHATQAAALYGCSVRHLWRAAGRLIPAPLAVGRLKRWRLGTLREHIRSGCKPIRQGGRG